MNKLVVYGVTSIGCKLAFYGSFVVTAFLVSKPLGFFVVTVSAIGLIADELKFREQTKLQEKAASELMQMLAAKTGQGSC